MWCVATDSFEPYVLRYHAAKKKSVTGVHTEDHLIARVELDMETTDLFERFVARHRGNN